jgi:hypothetical protein
MPKVGKERGCPPATRPRFDALRGPAGALFDRRRRTVAQKVLYVNELLGGPFSHYFSNGSLGLPHRKMLRSIELLGTRVAPIVRKEFTPSIHTRIEAGVVYSSEAQRRQGHSRVDALSSGTVPDAFDFE